MSKLFKPAVALMQSLSFFGKFTLIFLIVLIPLTSLSYTLIADIKSETQSIELEDIGLQYLEVAREPLELMQQHRGLVSTYLSGNTEFLERIMKKRQEVDRSLKALHQVNDKYASELSTNNLVADIKTRWDKVKANSLNQDISVSIAEQTEMITKLITLFRTVADSSNITHDARLDTHYLGVTIVKSLPQLIETMGQTRAAASSIAAKGSFTPDSFIRLSILAESIKSYSTEMRTDLTSAFDYSPSLKKALQQAVTSNDKEIEKFQSLLHTHLFSPERITVSSEEVFDIATRAISSSYQLFDKVSPELHALFSERIREKQILQYIEMALVITVILLLCYLFTGFYVSVISNIKSVTELTNKMAKGDLSSRLVIRSKDEMQQIAADFNTMAEIFESLILEIKTSTLQLASASEEFAVISKESATNLSRQSRETTEVATAMNEMTMTVQEVAKSANDAAEAAEHADAESSAGKKIVEETSESIACLAQEVENAAGVIELLANDSSEISKVLDVIKDIAEQTNLLALNAAIEAARAGEQGRGFAVVADEVRTLASRTQESTQEIENMIARLQNGAKDAVSVMQSGKTQAQAGAEQTTHGSTALEAITRAVGVIHQMNLQIASASEQQNATVEEINKNILNINELSEQTSISAEQSKSSSEELSRLAISLQELIERFTLSDNSSTLG